MLQWEASLFKEFKQNILKINHELSKWTQNGTHWWIFKKNKEYNKLKERLQTERLWRVIKLFGMSKNSAIIESNALEAEKNMKNFYATSTSETFGKFLSSLVDPVYQYYKNLVVDTKFDIILANKGKVLNNLLKGSTLVLGKLIIRF